MNNDEAIANFWVHLNLMMWYGIDTFDWADAFDAPPDVTGVDEFALLIIYQVNVVDLKCLTKILVDEWWNWLKLFILPHELWIVQVDNRTLFQQ